MRKLSLAISLCLVFIFTALNVAAQTGQTTTQGELYANGANAKALGACPLKSTNVQAEITGFLSRVKVTQEFENNFSEKIEAVYVFPLPHDAAVDDMTMRIGANGERVVRGKIMKREEARQVYDNAKSSGQAAALLDQERPNIFTQSVANILPGEKIVIEISYVETLKYDDGSYEFVFPMTVAPRYTPAITKSAKSTKISPPLAVRPGHDISINVRLDAGVPVESVTSKSHQIRSAARSASSFDVNLKSEKTIPNKDFILRFDVAGKKISDAVLTHRSAKGGYFTLILQPPDKVADKDVTPKEIVFVLDTSGSMSGFPIEKAKESMNMALAGLHPQDTFNLITFAGDTEILFDQPVPATPENLKTAQAFLSAREGDGGTEMMTAIRAALEPSASQTHTRIVCFMTDGHVGNESEIIEEIQKNGNARVFSFGIGDSVNRYLLDKMASEGRGEVEYVSLEDDGSAAAKRFHERVRSPLLTDVSIDYGNLQVADVYPQRINDLFSAKPVIVHGRFTGAGRGVIKLRGMAFGREVVREIPVNFPENEPGHDVLATLWARTRIDQLTLMEEDENYVGGEKEDLEKAILNLGLEYRLMTQYTSFVAVEDRVISDGGTPRKVEVPAGLSGGISEEVIVVGAGSGTASGAGNGSAPAPAASATVSGLPQSVVEITADSTANVSTQAEVTVTSGGIENIVNTTDASLGTNFVSKQIQELPINGRRISNLLTLQPGTAAGTGTPRSLNDPRNAAPTVGVAYKSWLANDVAYIISADDRRMLKEPGIKIVSMPTPSISPAMNKAIKPGTIAVGVTLDGAGKLVKAEISAKETGREALEKILEDAARSAKFEIPKNLRSVDKVSGFVVYNFTEDKKLEAADRLFNAEVHVKQNKYHWEMKALIDRVAAKLPAARSEAAFVTGNKVKVVVRVSNIDDGTRAILEKAGFEYKDEMFGADLMTGSIPIDKMGALHDLEIVRFISPLRTGPGPK